mgnify:CR=1 FL=1
MVARWWLTAVAGVSMVGVLDGGCAVCLRHR